MKEGSCVRIIHLLTYFPNGPVSQGWARTSIRSSTWAPGAQTLEAEAGLEAGGSWDACGKRERIFYPLVYSSSNHNSWAGSGFNCITVQKYFKEFMEDVFGVKYTWISKLSAL